MPMNARLLRPRATGIASPLVISGCIGWYDSADLTAMAANSDGTGAVVAGSQVGYWKDKSATAAHVTQGTAANRPTLTANAVNGRTALVFDGSNDTLLRSNYTAQNSLASMTRIAVWRTSTAAMLSRTLNVSTFANAGGGIAMTFVSARLESGVGTAQRGSSLTGVMPIAAYANVYDGTAGTLQTFFNNVLQAQTYTNGTAIPATTDAGTPTIHIGSNIGLNNFVNGPIAEYLIYSRALSAVELTAIHNYLKKKWGL